MQSQLLEFIDISNTSLGIAGVVLILTTLVIKYALDYYNKDLDSDEKYPVWISVIIGILASFLSLVAFKQISIRSNSGDILTEPFPTRFGLVPDSAVGVLPNT